MKFDIHSSHKTILLLPLATYLVLVWLVAIAPAHEIGQRYPDVPTRPTTPLAQRGEQVYKAYGCTVCHTQQIRGDERVRVPMGDRLVVPVLPPDARYGLDEPTRPEEYASDSPPLLGTQRTGPDLTGVGDRLPSVLWHYWHLYDPRSVSPGSVMPSYRFLFRVTMDPDGKVDAEAPFNAGKAWLVLGVVAIVFVGLGWLLFGRSWTLVITLVLGLWAGYMVVRACEICAQPIEEGEVVEDGIDALKLPQGARLVATPDAKALAEYLLSLKRPTRSP